jgi:ferredoxin
MKDEGALESGRRAKSSSLIIHPSTMPDRNDKVKENVQPGAYYVDSSCIDCDVCRDTAPDNFTRSDENNYSFVYKQPETEEEVLKCEEAVLCCPVEAIGNDGEAVAE